MSARRMDQQFAETEGERNARLWAKRVKSAGQIAYEVDVKARPLYHDGKPRKAWSALGEPEQWSWGRNTRAGTDAPLGGSLRAPE